MHLARDVKSKWMHVRPSGRLRSPSLFTTDGLGPIVHLFIRADTDASLLLLTPTSPTCTAIQVY